MIARVALSERLAVVAYAGQWANTHTIVMGEEKVGSASEFCK